MKQYIRKNTFVLCLYFILGGWYSAGGQQIDGGFNAPWVKDTIGNGALPGKYLRPGTQPQGWQSSNVNQTVLATLTKEVVFPDTDRRGGDGYSVKMCNEFVGLQHIGANAPGYISLGVPWVYAILNLKKCDGGTLGGVPFTHRPDSVVGYYKRTIGEEGAEDALILTYFWKGCNRSVVKTNPDGGMITAKDKDVLDKELCILGLEDAESGDARLIAKGEYNVSTELKEWTRIAVPIGYYSDSIPEKMNIILSSANYWDRNAIKKGNIFWADDISFVYNSGLKNVMFDGEPLSGFDRNVYSYSGLPKVNGELPLVEVETDGKGATVKQSVSGNVVTVTVKGDDYSESNKNMHTYIFSFN